MRFRLAAKRKRKRRQNRLRHPGANSLCRDGGFFRLFPLNAATMAKAMTGIPAPGPFDATGANRRGMNKSRLRQRGDTVRRYAARKRSGHRGSREKKHADSGAEE